MDDAARKRQSPADGDSERQDPAKRPRTDDQKPASKSGPNSDAQLVSASNTETSLYELVNQTTAHDVGRDGLRRSIALALQHVGFEGASVEALESFTEATETCTISPYIVNLVPEHRLTASQILTGLSEN